MIKRVFRYIGILVMLASWMIIILYVADYFHHARNQLTLREVITDEFDVILKIENPFPVIERIQSSNIGDLMETKPMYSAVPRLYNEIRLFLETEITGLKEYSLQSCYYVEYNRYGKMLAFNMGLNSFKLKYFFMVYQRFLLPYVNQNVPVYKYSFYQYKYNGSTIYRIFIKNSSGNKNMYVLLNSNWVMVTEERKVLHYLVDNARGSSRGDDNPELDEGIFDERLYSGNLNFIGNNRGSDNLSTFYEPVNSLFQYESPTRNNIQGNFIITEEPFIKFELFYPESSIKGNILDTLSAFSVGQSDIEQYLPSFTSGFYTLNYTFPAINRNYYPVNMTGISQINSLDNLTCTFSFFLDWEDPVLLIPCEEMAAVYPEIEGMTLSDMEIADIPELALYINYRYKSGSDLCISRYNDMIYISNNRMLLEQIMMSFPNNKTLRNDKVYNNLKSRVVGQYPIMGFFTIAFIKSFLDENIIGSIIGDFDKAFVTIDYKDNYRMLSIYLFGEYVPTLVSHTGFPVQVYSDIIMKPQIINHPNGEGISCSNIYFFTEDGFLYNLSTDAREQIVDRGNLPFHPDISPIIKDLNKDKYPEVLFLTDYNDLYMMDYEGNVENNYPFVIDEPVFLAPFKNGTSRKFNIISVSTFSRVEKYDFSGNLYSDYPKFFDTTVKMARIYDLNMDQREDIIIINENEIAVYNHKLNPVSTFRLLNGIDNIDEVKIYYCDLTGDSTLEIILVCNQDDVSILDTKSKQMYSYTNIFNNYKSIISSTIVDVNRDNFLDILFITDDGAFHYLPVVRDTQFMGNMDVVDMFNNTVSYNIKLDEQKDYLFFKSEDRPALNSELLIMDIDFDNQWDIIYNSADNNVAAYKTNGWKIPYINIPASFPPIIDYIDDDNRLDILTVYENIIYLERLPSKY